MLQVRLGEADGHRAKEGIDEPSPQDEREPEERRQYTGQGIERGELATQNTVGRDNGEKSGPTLVAGEVGNHGAGETDDARQQDRPQHRVSSERDGEQRPSEPRIMHLVRGHGDDPGRHDKGEIAGKEISYPRVPHEPNRGSSRNLPATGPGRTLRIGYPVVG